MSEETIYKAQEKVKLNANSSLVPWLLIAGGIVLLVAGIFDVHLIDYLWPGFIIIPGLLMMLPAYNSTAEDRSRWSFLAVPGAVFITTGTLFFVMNLFDYFDAWAYTWPMIPASIAAGVLYVTRFDNNLRLERRSRKFIRMMAMLMVGLAFFFEIMVYENFNPLMSLGLITLGLYLLLQERKTAKFA